jgi:amino acid transporter
MHYAHNLWSGVNVFSATVVLLAVFALLTLLGIKESSLVALTVFIVHMATLTVLALSSAVVVAGDPSILAANWRSPTPDGALKALFFGFSAGMLGISGFESSANFIEEQKAGVFPKTLRNMWIAVAVFNPLLSLLAMGLLPLDRAAGQQEDLLAQMGLVAAGRHLQTWISIDAALVLSGAVLTSYVGVSGLVRRMALDRCLPQILLRETRRRSNHWIILSFFFVCWSILVITAGRVDLLAGVYTLSFLGVMALFAVGNMLLKVRRARLPRDIRATWPGVILGFVAVCAALVGNVRLNPVYVRVFAAYFAVALVVVGLMFLRVRILKVALAASRAIIERFRQFNRRLNRWIIRHIERINRQGVVFFTKGDNLETLNKAALYVLQNEQTKRLHVIHCFSREEEIPAELAEQLRTIDRIYPDLRVDLLLVKGSFGPIMIERLSRRLRVPKNYMFIGTPGDRFPHRIAELGGVRVII